MVEQTRERIWASQIICEKDDSLAGRSKSHVLAELGVGAANLTAIGAIIEHMNMERANDIKGGGIKYDITAENMIECIVICGAYC